MDPSEFRALPSVRASFSLACAERAIYFDYEGFPEAPPALLGWRVDSVYSAAILDDRYESCAGRRGAKPVACADHKATLSNLLDRASNESRHLVSWSLYDVRMAIPLLTSQQLKRLREAYVDGRQVARSWHRRFLGRVPPMKARLAYFGDLLQVAPPPQYGEHVMAGHLSTVDSALEQYGAYGAFPPDAKKAWRAVVQHNRWDLEQTCDVLLEVLRDDA